MHKYVCLSVYMHTTRMWDPIVAGRHGGRNKKSADHIFIQEQEVGEGGENRESGEAINSEICLNDVLPPASLLLPQVP